MGHPKDYSLFGLGVPGHPFFFSQMTRNDLYAAFLSHRWGSRKFYPPIFWAKYTHDVWQVPFSLPKTSVAFSFPPPTSLENTSNFRAENCGCKIAVNADDMFPHFKDLVGERTGTENPPRIPASFWSSWNPIKRSLGSRNLAKFGQQRVFFNKKNAPWKQDFLLLLS